MTTTRHLPRTIELQAAQAVRSDIDPSIRMAIAALQRQLSALNALVAAQATAAGTAAAENQYTTINNNIVQMTNASGGDVENGDVVVISTGADESFATTSTAGAPGVLGVVWSDSPDGAAPAILSGAVGMICVGGLASVSVNAATPIVAGDYLISSTTPGVAIRAPHGTDEGVFAVAAEALASGTGAIYAVLLPMPRLSLIFSEVLTADSASQVTLNQTPFSDGDGVYAMIYDAVNFTFSFPAAYAAWFGAHTRADLTAAGAVITHPAADFDTGAGSLVAFYLRNATASTDGILMMRDLIISAIQRATFSGVGAGAGGGYGALNTVSKTIEGALNELRNALWTDCPAQSPGNYQEAGYDLGGALTGLSGLIMSVACWVTAAKTSQIFHELFGYSNCVSNVFLISSVRSNLSEVGGTAVRVVAQALSYSGDLINQVTQSVTVIP